MRGICRIALPLVLTLVAGAVRGQGRTDYMNVESPQVHPLELVSVEGHVFLAACNTRNSTIEFFDTDEGAPERLAAVVKVGLEPVSARFNATLGQLFTANFLGDSVSVISLSAPQGPGSLSATLERTSWVGDEPLDIAFFAQVQPDETLRQTFFVTHMALDGIGWRDATTLDPIDGKALVPAVVPVTVGTTDLELAAKEPYAVLVRDDTLFVLALKGGTNSLDALDFDLDYYCDDLADPFVDPIHVGGLGTTGFSMGADADGNLYVVGAEALNDVFKDEPAVKNAPTGFVRSTFHRIENPCSDAPVVMTRDVNLASAGILQHDPGTIAQPGSSGGLTTLRPEVDRAPPHTSMRPVAKKRALSMLTDLTVFETGPSGPKVFFTAFGNDRVGVIEPKPAPSNPDHWKLRRIDIATVNGNPLAGPNGLALKRATPTMGNDPGPRLYVLNHLDASIVTIDPVHDLVVPGAELSLSHDPRPQHLTLGQQFLYDSNLSGNGFDSCASCHINGRTDGRVWDLGDPSLPNAPVPGLLPDAIDDTEFAADKNDMVTQSLQGLLNFELAPASQFWVTNAPYHWRGDRNTFEDFNGAFESLLGGVKLTDEQMARYEEFINTIHYPPNPKQQRDREPSGLFGTGESLATDDSSGAHRGSKIYHTLPTVGIRSCASGCHAGAEGSNNRLTESGLNAMGQIIGNPIEVAALRGLFQKEAKRDVDGSSQPKDSPYTGVEGLLHTGFVPNGGNLEEFNFVGSINGFNKAFSPTVCGTPGEVSHCTDLEELNQFIHEFDWGVGPMVGCAVTVDSLNAADVLPIDLPDPASMGCDGACSDPASTLDCLEQQAGLANSGLAVTAVIAGDDHGYWYDPSIGSYREEPSGPPLGRAALIAQLTSPKDRLVFQGVPLGDERRIAAPDGIPAEIDDGGAPSNLTLLPMRTNTFYRRIPELQGAWSALNNTNLQSLWIHTVRLYQWGLILDGAAENGFGLGSELRHEPARRFRVSGDGIRHGASLVLGYFNGPAGPPNPDLGFEQGPFALIDVPIYPTDQVDPGGKTIWESAVELEALQYYGLMLGGPFAPGVAAAYTDQKPFQFPMQDPALDKPDPGQFDPVGWNWIYVFVLNADGNFGDGGLQRLTIE